jgi:hypothetical protein
MAGSAVLGLGLMSLANVAMATELSDKIKCLQDNQKYRQEYTAQLKVNNKTYTDGLKAAGVVRKDAEKVAQDNYKAAVLAAKNKLKADLDRAIVRTMEIIKQRDVIASDNFNGRDNHPRRAA